MLRVSLEKRKTEDRTDFTIAISARGRQASAAARN
tara:strand:- start:602 stop:706 length:105 start_codon:yes stop_codon:yes gene_type:complete